MDGGQREVGTCLARKLTLNTVTIVAQTVWHSGGMSSGLMTEPCLAFSSVLKASFRDITAVAMAEKRVSNNLS